MNNLGEHIVSMDVIGRILLLGLIAGSAILVGYWLIDRVSRKQADENEQHIKDLRETIRVLRGMNGAD